MPILPQEATGNSLVWKTGLSVHQLALFAVAEPCGEKVRQPNTCPQCSELWPTCKCPSWPLKFILFARVQVFWLLNTQFTFEGVAGFTDEKVHGTRQTSANFESVSVIVAEVEARLACCGEAGEALQDEAPRAERIPASATNPKESYYGLSPPAMRALNYCSGFRRKLLSYENWKKQAKYRGSKLVQMTTKSLHC